LNPQSQAISSENVVLLRMPLGRHQDLVSFRRETRAAAEQCGLDARSVRSLSAASYEAARLLFGETQGAGAEIAVTPSGALQISIRIDALSADERQSVGRSVSALSSLLHRVAVHDAASPSCDIDGVLACPANRTLSLVRNSVDAEPKPIQRCPTVEENAKLRRALIELQDELTETNRVR
jgi:hypothetical protein